MSRQRSARLRVVCAALALLCLGGTVAWAPPSRTTMPTQAFQVWTPWTTHSPPPKPPPPSPSPRAPLAATLQAPKQPLVVQSPPPPSPLAQSAALRSQSLTLQTPMDQSSLAQSAPAIGRLASPGRPAVTPLPAGARRVCVFDFDDTLKTAGDGVAADAAWVVQACVANGYDVAIATASCKAAYVRTFLQRRVDFDIFHDAFFNSSGMQSCVADKTVTLTAIAQHYGLDDARRCLILFDDLQYNCRYASSIGMGSRWVDNGRLQFEVGEPGITVDDFFAAQDQWARTCPDAAPPPPAEATPPPAPEELPL